MLHRIFTVRTEIRQPSRQLAASPQKRGCDCKHCQTLLLPITKSWVPTAGGEWFSHISHGQAQDLPEQLVSLWQAPQNHLSCPQYQGWITLSWAWALENHPEYRTESSNQDTSFQQSAFPHRSLGVVETKDFSQAMSFLLKKVNPAHDGQTYTQEASVNPSEISWSHLNTAATSWCIQRTKLFLFHPTSASRKL